MNSNSRITIGNRNEYDNPADPAGSSSSVVSNDPAASLSSVVTNNDDPAGSSRSVATNNDDPAATSSPNNNTNSRSNPSTAIQSGSPTANESTNGSNAADSPELTRRMDELRAILPDFSNEELRQMLGENDRAEGNSRQSASDALTATAMTSASASNPPPSTRGATPAGRGTTPAGRGPTPAGRGATPAGRGATPAGRGAPQLLRANSSARRSWQPCAPAPSRPGVFRVGGPIEQGETYNIGVTDEMELEIKRIEAVSQVQDALNEKLGYNLRESGKYEELEREYKEGERKLSSTGLEHKNKILPKMMTWAAPPVSRKSLSRKEPDLPEPGEPLPLPLSFGEDEEGVHNGGNGEIALGKFVDPGPDRDEDEEKREESSIADMSTFSGISVDASSMGPYEHAVRCWKCRAGLKVHIEVGLVACPRCRTISPTTEMANIG